MHAYAVVQKPVMMVVGIECRTANTPEAAEHDFPQHWGRFFSEEIRHRIPNKASDEVIALYCDYEGDHTKPFSFVIGCQTISLDEIPAGMVGKLIPASTYAVFQAVGEYPASLIETWGNIWQTDLPRTYTGDFEFYGERFVSGSPKEVDVFIAIEP